MKTTQWKYVNIDNAKYIGCLEFQDNKGEYHIFEVVSTGEKLVFGGVCNAGLLQSGYIKNDIGYESLDETLQELLSDLETYYNEGKEYTSRIIVNDRM